MKSPHELRLEALLDERDNVHQKHEALLASVMTNDDNMPNKSQGEQIASYREREVELDTEISALTDDVERGRKADESSKAIRRILSGSNDGVDIEGDDVSYRTMAAFARDEMLSRRSGIGSRIASQYVDHSELDRISQRLELAKRTANTLSSNVGGLQPPQHIDQIFQVINKSRALVASGIRADLVRGSVTYPQVTTRPIVAVQAAEKSEGGSQGMVVDMETATADTYLGGGDLSWQAINWSTPDALQLWFDLAAADYALKTEQACADVFQVSAFAHVISSPLSSTPTFAEFMTAVGAGYAKVFADSGRIADTIYLAPDRFGYMLGLTSAAWSQFLNVSGSSIGPLSFVISRGFDAGVIAVGDKAGLLVAETAGAPVELRVVEPAIGGVEVGIIGAFKAVVVDGGAFSLLSTAT